MESFTSASNKYELWNKFTTKGFFEHVFTGNDSDNAQIATEVQNVFEQSISHVSTNPTLKKLNTKELKEIGERHFKRELKNYIDSRENKVFQNYSLNSFEKPVANKIHEKNSILDQKFQNKQNEYDNMMKKKEPEAIDFRTVKEEPFIENMDDLINETLQKRQLELSQIMDSMPKPKDNNETTDKDVMNNNSNINDRNLNHPMDNSSSPLQSQNIEPDSIQNTIVHHNSMDNSVSFNRVTNDSNNSQPKFVPQDIKSILDELVKLKKGDKAQLRIN